MSSPAEPTAVPGPVVDETAGELVVDWDQYHRLIEHLAVQIHRSSWAFDQIVALSRGGLRVGDLLSRVFDRPLVVMAAQSYGGQGTASGGSCGWAISWPTPATTWDRRCCWWMTWSTAAPPSNWPATGCSGNCSPRPCTRPCSG